MRINKIRSLLYKSARILGDVNAAKNGTLGKRVARRAAGKATGKIFRAYSNKETPLHIVVRGLFVWTGLVKKSV
ncbi:hypothetical protein QL281_04650 [Bacillus subtilis]|uniref:Uncharacterized protein n=1 Tax=Bacillus subtilis TaxID=1423 RepID=A0AAQ3IK41_BACIU|nr:hypothetical protein [Bacillus subtilis]WHM23793.1 hypothetical protein QL281_04650 [Bacillus subtilis]